jgi:secondary thiamine-phosphate synthase enzyme
MQTLSKSVSIRTSEPFEVVDIAKDVEHAVDAMRLKDGIVVVTTTHTTTGVCINERCNRLQEDMRDFLLRLAPPNANYRHNHETVDGRNNAHSHLLSMLLRNSETIPVSSGKLRLGAWQTVFFVELDGPRPERNIILTAIGEFQK